MESIYRYRDHRQKRAKAEWRRWTATSRSSGAEVAALEAHRAELLAARRHDLRLGDPVAHHTGPQARQTPSNGTGIQRRTADRAPGIDPGASGGFNTNLIPRPRTPYFVVSCLRRTSPRYKEFALPAKLVVTARKGGTQISLVGTSGTELLSSVIFREPRAKGATVRALKGLLGENVTVEDHTAQANGRRSTDVAGASKPVAPSEPTAIATKKPSRPAVKRSTTSRARKPAARRATNPTKTTAKR